MCALTGVPVAPAYTPCAGPPASLRVAGRVVRSADPEEVSIRQHRDASTERGVTDQVDIDRVMTGDILLPPAAASALLVGVALLLRGLSR